MSAPLAASSSSDRGAAAQGARAPGQRVRRRARATASPSAASSTAPARRALVRHAAPARGGACARSRAAAEPSALEVKLMPVSVGLDAAGKPTPALEKKLQALGLRRRPGAPQAPHGRQGRVALRRRTTDAGACRSREALQAALDEALAALPIPKVMSYQLADGDHGAVRAPGARAGRAARRRRRAGEGARTRSRAHDARPPLPGRGAIDARARRRLRARAAPRRAA